MPILELEYVESDAPVTDELAQRVADAAGEIFGTPAGSTWVKVRRIARSDYAENLVALDAKLAPVFVRVWLASPPETAARAVCARQLADAIAECIARPADQVHILFEPGALGRIAFGGVLRD